MTARTHQIEAQRAAAMRRDQAIDRRVQAKNLSLLKKTLGGGDRLVKGRRVCAGTRTIARSFSGASKNAGKHIRAGRSFPLIFKSHAGSLNGLTYSEHAKGAVWLDAQNVELAATAAERRALLAIESQYHPRVKTEDVYLHFSLSSHPDLPDPIPDVWRKYVRDFLRESGFEGCSFSNTLHPRSPDHSAPHAHVVVSRHKPDGGLVNMSWGYYKFRDALRRVEALNGLKTVEIKPSSPRPTDSVVNLQRREVRIAAQEKRQAYEVWIDPVVIQKVLHQARDMGHFRNLLDKAGIDSKVAENGKGILFKRTGQEAYMAGSALDRILSLPSIQRQLIQNQSALSQSGQRQAAQRLAQARQSQQLRHKPGG